MYDHILEEMADAIAFELNVTSNNVLSVQYTLPQN